MKHALLPLLSLALPLIGVAQETREEQPESRTLRTESGRFVLGQIGVMRADQYLLDTQSGRVWELVVDKSGNRMFRAVPIEHANGVLGFIAEPEDEAASIVLSIERKPPANSGQESPKTITSEKPKN